MPRYIDAEKLLTRLYNKDDVQLFNIHEFQLVLRGRVAMVINEMPAADVQEVKHGKWIPTTNGKFECSLCHSMWNRRFLHDPHCGAKMDLEGGDGE